MIAYYEYMRDEDKKWLREYADMVIDTAAVKNGAPVIDLKHGGKTKAIVKTRMDACRILWNTVLIDRCHATLKITPDAVVDTASAGRLSTTMMAKLLYLKNHVSILNINKRLNDVFGDGVNNLSYTEYCNNSSC